MSVLAVIFIIIALVVGMAPASVSSELIPIGGTPTIDRVNCVSVQMIDKTRPGSDILGVSIKWKYDGGPDASYIGTGGEKAEWRKTFSIPSRVQDLFVTIRYPDGAEVVYRYQLPRVRNLSFPHGDRSVFHPIC